MENILITETKPNLRSEGLPLKDYESKGNNFIFPVYKVFLPLSCQSDKIIESFKKVCTANQFKINYQSSHRLVAISVPRFSLKRYFSCITGDDESDTLTQVDLQISIMTCPNQKLINVQGLQGCVTKQAILINSFKSELRKILNSRDLHYNDQPSSKRVQLEIANFLASEEGISQINNLTHSLSRNFDIKKIKAAIIEIIKSTYNSHPTSVKSMYLKTLEQVVFSKYSQELSQHYSEKTEEKQKLFLSKTHKLLGKSNNELFEILLIKEKYRLKNDPDPYIKPINLLNTISKKHTPVSKLDTLFEVHVLIRTTVFEYWKGRVELESMDDILPIYIFIIIKSELPSLLTDILMLEDYIRISQDMENEERLIVNYRAAIQYIQNECF